MPNVHCPKSALLLAVAGVFVGSVSALAQGAPYGGGPTESVIVVAPRLRADTTPLNAPPGRAYLSVPVRYDDLDLLTLDGADAFRWRVWQTANDLCNRLADAYPVVELSTAKTCVQSAYEDGMVKAYRVINDTRISYRYGY